MHEQENIKIPWGINMRRIKTRKMSMYIKLLIAFILITSVTTVTIGALSYNSNANAQISMIKTNLKNIAYGASLMIDSEGHASLKAGDEAKAIYTSQVAMLSKLAAESKARYIYTLVKSGEGTQFILDSSMESKIGDEYELSGEMTRAFNGETVVTDSPYTDEFGTFYTGYAPVYDSTGKVTAIMAADFDVSPVSSALRNELIRTVLLCAASILISAMASFYIATRFRKSIELIAEKIEDIVGQSGDLTQSITVDTGDELEYLADLVNLLIKNIASVVIEIKRTSSKVADQLGYALQSSESITVKAEGQSNCIKEVAATTEEIATTVSAVASDAGDFAHAVMKTTENGYEALKKADEMVRISVSSKSSISEMSDKMTESYDSINRLTESILHVKKSTKEIMGIVTIIDGISSQTNLLALNAAIEAARAGEVGRGFAVVADEIRNLAESSTKATGVISDLVNSVETLVDRTVSDVDQSACIISRSLDMSNGISERMDGMFENVKDTADRLNDIMAQIESISGHSQDIAANTQEQAAGTEEILSTTESVLQLAYVISNECGQINSILGVIRNDYEMMESSISKFKV
jgi:methyl-accepting chemotaxis protein